VGVDVALVAEAQAGSGQVVDVEVREAPAQVIDAEDRGVNAAGALDLVVLEDGRHALLGGEEQVAGLAEGQVGRLAAHFDVGVEVGEEAGGELREGDVDRVGELVADTGLREGRRGAFIGGVGLDDEHGAVVVGVLGQPVRHGTAVDGAADDDSVIVAGCRCAHAR
jgi:hypothetical protein